MRRCATRSSNSPPRSGTSSPRISPTSTARSSPSSTCRRPSRERFLPAIRAIPGPCGGSTSRSSRPTRRPPAGPSTPRRASAPRSSTSGSSSATATTRSPRSAAPTSPASGSPTSSPRSCSGAASPPTSSSRPATSPTTSRCPRTPGRLPLLPRRAARARVRRGDGRGLLDLLAPRSSGSRTGRRSAGRAATASPRGLAALDPGQGARPAARPAAGGDPQPRRHLRLRARPTSS